MPNHTIRVTARCKYKDKNGVRCKCNTVITHPYCASHTRKVLGLYVAKSTIKGAGLGLFTLKPFKKGDTVVEYAGEKILTSQYNKRYENDDYGEYGMDLNSRYTLDARKTSAGLGRYVCDHFGSGKKPNVQYQSTNKRVDIVAIQDIKPGEEILVSYGRAMRKAMGLIK